MSISACIISKNEEKNIKRCLDSIKDLVDEIIIVDTGSMDETINIAEGYGAKIIRTSFDDDFSLCRNLALERATKDWILCIDCDESISIYEIDKLKLFLDSCTHVGVTLKVINVIDEDIYQGPHLLRLFKNNENFKYTGRIHEQIISSIYENYSNKDIINTNFTLHHYGYGGKSEEMSKKHERNLQIFDSYSEKEKDGFYYFNYANEHFAFEEYGKAINLYNKAITYDDNEVGFKNYIPVRILRCFYETRNYDAGIEKALDLLKSNPNLRDIYFMLGSLYKESGDNIKAKESYEKYMELSKNPILRCDSHFDKMNNMDTIIKSLK